MSSDSTPEIHPQPRPLSAEIIGWINRAVDLTEFGSSGLTEVIFNRIQMKNELTAALQRDTGLWALGENTQAYWDRIHDVTTVLTQLFKQRDSEAERLVRINDFLAEPFGRREKVTADESAKASKPTVWFHGERQYSIDGDTLHKVSPEHDYILQAFLESPEAMETRDLESKSGVRNVSRAIQALNEWKEGIFSPAIRTPGAKSKGGYFIRVLRVEGSL